MDLPGAAPAEANAAYTDLIATISRSRRTPLLGFDLVPTMMPRPSDSDKAKDVARDSSDDAERLVPSYCALPCRKRIALPRNDSEFMNGPMIINAMRSSSERYVAPSTLAEHTSSTPVDRGHASLAALPAEIICMIANLLDNTSWLQLAIAWRPFLHTFARSLDPWNSVRKRLTDSDERGCFKMVKYVLFCRYYRCRDCCIHDFNFCECGWWFDCDLTPSTDFFCALIEYCQLDSYRRAGSSRVQKRPLILGMECPEMLRALALAWSSLPSTTVSAGSSFAVRFCMYGRRHDPRERLIQACCGNTHEPEPAFDVLSEALCCQSLPLIEVLIGSAKASIRKVPAARFSKFCSALSVNKTLESVIIRHWPTGDKQMESVISGISNKPHLRELYVRLRGPCSTHALAELLLANTTKLEVMHVHSHPELDEMDMIKLGKAAVTSNTLRILHLVDFFHWDVLQAFIDAFLDGYRLGSTSLMGITIRMSKDNAMLYGADEDTIEAAERKVQVRTKGRTSLRMFSDDYGW